MAADVCVAQTRGVRYLFSSVLQIHERSAASMSRKFLYVPSVRNSILNNNCGNREIVVTNILAIDNSIARSKVRRRQVDASDNVMDTDRVARYMKGSFEVDFF